MFFILAQRQSKPCRFALMPTMAVPARRGRVLGNHNTNLANVIDKAAVPLMLKGSSGYLKDEGEEEDGGGYLLAHKDLSMSRGI